MSAIAGVYVNENEDDVDELILNEPPPFSDIKTSVAEPPKVPVIVAGFVAHVKLFDESVSVGSFAQPQFTFTIVLFSQPAAFRTDNV
jgi:hypothetical protein